MSLVQRKVLYAAGLVAVVAVLALAVFSSPLPNKETSNTSYHYFQVLKTNVSVSYDAECMVLEASGHTCPTVARNATGASPSSLRGVELVAYLGTDYYAGNFSSGPFGQLSVASRNILFTNSTIFCVSPPFGNYVACPIAESLPSAVW